MTTINHQNAGLAEIQTDAFTSVELLAGDTPAIVTDYGLAGSLGTPGIPAWTPVFVDEGTRAITLAVIDTGTPANSVYPNAVTVADTPAGAATTASVPVYKAGSFNIRALNWPATFDTDAKKFGAFGKGVGSHQIFVKLPYNQA